MWMVGYNEGGEFNMPDHAFSGRKLRPLVPRPLTSPISTDFFSQYHHNLASVGEQGKREVINTSAPAASVVVSTRWNPTPEQLRALEELYRRGTRTPSAEQIQHITAQLRRFGKIEGKNVFYWFQNHKARERQKRRRQVEMESAAHHDLEALENYEKKDSSGASRTVFEVEQTSKNWAHCTSTHAEESVSIQRATKATVAECSRTDGWVQFEEGGETQQRRSFTERNATWQMMMMMMQSSCPPPTAAAADASTATSTTSIAAATTACTVMDPKLIKNHCDDLSFFNVSSLTENGVVHLNSRISREDDNNNCVESQTLQLFPLRSGGGDHGCCNNIINQQHKETDVISVSSSMNANLTPSQFFEFLPLKN